LLLILLSSKRKILKSYGKSALQRLKKVRLTSRSSRKKTPKSSKKSQLKGASLADYPMEYEDVIDPKREFLKEEPLDETHWLDKEERKPKRKTTPKRKANKAKGKKSDNVGSVSRKKSNKRS